MFFCYHQKGHRIRGQTLLSASSQNSSRISLSNYLLTEVEVIFENILFQIMYFLAWQDFILELLFHSMVSTILPHYAAISKTNKMFSFMSRPVMFYLTDEKQSGSLLS